MKGGREQREFLLFKTWNQRAPVRMRLAKNKIPILQLQYPVGRSVGEDSLPSDAQNGDNQEEVLEEPRLHSDSSHGLVGCLPSSSRAYTPIATR